ncbi:MAG: IS66 family transposase, partial [Exilibacterium sp.]
DAAIGADGALSYQAAKPYIERYRKILAQGEHEYPKDTARKGGPKGPIHQTKARNLLDRLRDYEDAALRFFNQ